MFRRNLLPIWLGIIVISGMFLMGQETWPPPACVDNDGDGYGSPASASCTYPELDCNDNNPKIYPGAGEVCDNGVDDDCDGLIDGYDQCDLAPIPAGLFLMGDAFGEGFFNELPVHNVYISAFEMDMYEVTNAKYAECVAAGGCTAPVSSSSYTRTSYYGNPAYALFPVIYVDWNQANAYCTWAGKRLPTEAEWEYAARGDLTGKRYPWGDTISGTNANYYNSGDPWDDDTSPVGYYPPNGFRLYDMAGNVWEWVNDWYQDIYYWVSPSIDPPGPAGGTAKVLRGGSWGNYVYGSAYNLRVAYRSFFNPGFVYDLFGFRCAR